MTSTQAWHAHIDSTKRYKRGEGRDEKMVAPHDSLAGIALNVELTAMDVDQMTVIKLREALEERSLDTSGLKHS